MVCGVNADNNAATKMADDAAADNDAATQMTDNAAMTMPQCRQQHRDTDDDSTMQTMGNNADNDNADNNADDNADVNTDDNTTTQTMDEDADDGAREVKTISGTSEEKMGRGGGCWGRRGGHWGRQGGLK